jgi:hypothetical protein
MYYFNYTNKLKALKKSKAKIIIQDKHKNKNNKLDYKNNMNRFFYIIRILIQYKLKDNNLLNI